MERKIAFSFVIATLLILSTFAAVNFNVVRLRPMNQMEHPGLTNPYHPPEDGPNHRGGPSDYKPRFNRFWSELCENDRQFRPANQGLNILKFFSCAAGSD